MIFTNPDLAVEQADGFPLYATTTATDEAFHAVWEHKGFVGLGDNLPDLTDLTVEEIKAAAPADRFLFVVAESQQLRRPEVFTALALPALPAPKQSAAKTKTED